MPSTLPRESCTRMHSRSSILNSRISQCHPRAMSCHSRFKWLWSKDRKCPKMPGEWSFSATSQRSGLFIKNWTRAVLWTVGRPWSVWSSPVSKTRSRCSKRSPRRRSLSVRALQSLSSVVNLKKWLRLRLASAIRVSGKFEHQINHAFYCLLYGRVIRIRFSLLLLLFY